MLNLYSMVFYPITPYVNKPIYGGGLKNVLKKLSIMTVNEEAPHKHMQTPMRDVYENSDDRTDNVEIFS